MDCMVCWFLGGILSWVGSYFFDLLRDDGLHLRTGDDKVVLAWPY